VVLNKTFRPLILAGVVAGLLLCAAVRAQAQHHGGGGSGGGFGGMGGGHNGMGGSREGMGDRGKTIKHLSLRPEQKERMDEIFNANKGSLLNTFANLQREETRLGTMTPQDLQDETKVFAAIDRVTQARAGLEKESAHIQMQLRQQLTPAQVSMLDQQIASLH
jgi:Spy/CpxP family protein refolding chaperone